MNKKFKASKSLLSYLENVLHRNGSSYKVINNKNELFIETDISGTHFHNYVVRAKMEKLQEEDNSPIPYVTAAEAVDPKIMQDIGNAYIIK